MTWTYAIVGLWVLGATGLLAAIIVEAWADDDAADVWGFYLVAALLALAWPLWPLFALCCLVAYLDEEP